ncbi:hypothetical protein [Micromonospora fulviviridis]|uniref:Uncharacterized protein n=1 Tax=Micromonospora fulviviridis TaxID=47860 RepID=A0ABV2VV65_9ACTN
METRAVTIPVVEGGLPADVIVPSGATGVVLFAHVNIEGFRSEAVGRYALGGLQGIRSAVAETLSPEDLTALDQLLDTSSRTASCAATT